MASTKRLSTLPLVIAAAAIVVITLCLAPAPALSAFDYYAVMTGGEMVPPTSSPGTGTFNGTFGAHHACPGSGIMDVTIEVQDLEGSPTAISIWIGPAGAVGDLLARVPASGGEVPFTADNCDQLLDGNMYVVVETDAYPDGEIRGVIFEELSHPVEPASWGLIKQTYR